MNPARSNRSASFRSSRFTAYWTVFFARFFRTCFLWYFASSFRTASFGTLNILRTAQSKRGFRITGN